ncbi:sensor histidine kinase [Nocardioides sp. GCM10027113]|uniref:sensor histidine kinase n=1 Tax=unclassified Nocardioides TaxID=2615069 RepID=UPI0036093066
MRERITAAFVLLAVVVLVSAGVVRGFTLQDLMREQEDRHLREHAALVAELVEQRVDAGKPVGRAFLGPLVPQEGRLEYAVSGGSAIEVQGEKFEGSSDSDLTVAVRTPDGLVTMSEPSPGFAPVARADIGELVTLFLLIGLLAGATGWLAARGLSRPFQKLAVAAGALGRGRFDLELPRTRIPEAQAIGQSLRTSAMQLESRLRRERDFAEHASHVLRTPLTSLRLELEDLTLRDDVPEDARAAAERGLRCVDDVNASAGELVALSRKGVLVEGAQVSLREMATDLAQRWADRLGEDRRRLSARAEGDLDLKFTPGPVEQVLDLVLADVVLSGKEPVRMAFVGEENHLRVRMPAGVIAAGTATNGHGRLAAAAAGVRAFLGPRRPQPGAGLAEARAVAEAQGGRVVGDGVTDDLEILLPRR